MRKMIEKQESLRNISAVKYSFHSRPESFQALGPLRCRGLSGDPKISTCCSVLRLPDSAVNFIPWVIGNEVHVGGDFRIFFVAKHETSLAAWA